MSAAIDTNILLYASDSSSLHHAAARTFLEELAESPRLFYVFWPVVMAYLRIATHPTVFAAPLEPRVAAENIESLLALPNARTAGETERFWEVWCAAVRDVPVRGNLVPDAHLVALMHEHGIGTLYTRDRGFRRFDGIHVVDPFAGGD